MSTQVPLDGFFANALTSVSEYRLYSCSWPFRRCRFAKDSATSVVDSLYPPCLPYLISSLRFCCRAHLPKPPSPSGAARGRDRRSGIDVCRSMPGRTLAVVPSGVGQDRTTSNKSVERFKMFDALITVASRGMRWDTDRFAAAVAVRVLPRCWLSMAKRKRVCRSRHFSGKQPPAVFYCRGGSTNRAGPRSRVELEVRASGP